MERISSPLAEFVKVLYTKRVLIIARAVPTKRATVLCVEKRFWIPKTTNVCLGVLKFLIFCMILLFALNFQGTT